VEPPVDYGLDAPDLTNFDAGDCSEVAGYRRCATCALPCTGPTYCNPAFGLCATREPDGTNENCGGFLPDGGVFTDCPDGELCALGLADLSVSGLCLGPDRPADLCAAGAAAGVLQCFYGDGSVYDRGPATSPACAPGTAMTPTCGGTCGPADCPTNYLDPSNPLLFGLPGTCVGVNERRSYGICPYNASDDSCGTFPGFSLYLEGCEITYGSPCACVELSGPTVPPRSYLIEAAACRVYAAAFPDLVRCLRPDGTPLD